MFKLLQDPNSASNIELGWNFNDVFRRHVVNNFSPAEQAYRLELVDGKRPRARPVHQKLIQTANESKPFDMDAYLAFKNEKDRAFSRYLSELGVDHAKEFQIRDRRHSQPPPRFYLVASNHSFFNKLASVIYDNFGYIIEFHEGSTHIDEARKTIKISRTQLSAPNFGDILQKKLFEPLSSKSQAVIVNTIDPITGKPRDIDWHWYAENSPDLLVIYAQQKFSTMLLNSAQYNLLASNEPQRVMSFSQIKERIDPKLLGYLRLYFEEAEDHFKVALESQDRPFPDEYAAHQKGFQTAIAIKSGNLYDFFTLDKPWESSQTIDRRKLEEFVTRKASEAKLGETVELSFIDLSPSTKPSPIYNPTLNLDLEDIGIPDFLPVPNAPKSSKPKVLLALRQLLFSNLPKEWKMRFVESREEFPIKTQIIHVSGASEGKGPLVFVREYRK